MTKEAILCMFRTCRSPSRAKAYLGPSWHMYGVVRSVALIAPPTHSAAKAAPASARTSPTLTGTMSQTAAATTKPVVTGERKSLATQGIRTSKAMDVPQRYMRKGPTITTTGSLSTTPVTLLTFTMMHHHIPSRSLLWPTATATRRLQVTRWATTGMTFQPAWLRYSMLRTQGHLITFTRCAHVALHPWSSLRRARLSTMMANRTSSDVASVVCTDALGPTYTTSFGF
jgi:hypothetical protein